MKYVMVDCVSSFRQRYCVAVPDDCPDPTGWAQDTVTCEEATEFSQQHIGEQIFATRIITRDEVLKQFDEDNDYLKEWADDYKLEQMVCVINNDGEVISGGAEWKD